MIRVNIDGGVKSCRRVWRKDLVFVEVLAVGWGQNNATLTDRMANHLQQPLTHVFRNGNRLPSNC